jgi:hypothetical protein
MAVANILLEQWHGDTGVHMQQKHGSNRSIENGAQSQEQGALARRDKFENNLLAAASCRGQKRWH